MERLEKILLEFWLENSHTQLKFQAAIIKSCCHGHSHPFFLGIFCPFGQYFGACVLINTPFGAQFVFGPVISLSKGTNAENA